MSSYIPKAKPIAALPGTKKEFTNVKPAIDTKMPAKFLRHVQKPFPVRSAANAETKTQEWNPSVEIVRKDDIKPLPGKKQTLESLKKTFHARPAPNFKAIHANLPPIQPALPAKKQTLESVKNPFRARPAPDFKAIHADLPPLKLAVPAKKQTPEPQESVKKPFRATPAPDFKAIHADLPPLKPALPAKKQKLESQESEKKPFRARPAPDFKTIHALLPPAKPTRSRIPVRLQSVVSAPSIQETATETSAFESKIPIRKRNRCMGCIIS